VDANVIEIPRFGWIVKSTLGNTATVEYQRKNIKLNMTLSIDISYLHNEL
jgi:hypothetical protein